MGYSKCKVISDTEVAYFHQLGQDGKAYAEDVFVRSEVPGRLDYAKSQDGKVGVLNFGFSPQEGDFSAVKFPEVAE